MAHETSSFLEQKVALVTTIPALVKAVDRALEGQPFEVFETLLQCAEPGKAYDAILIGPNVKVNKDLDLPADKIVSFCLLSDKNTLQNTVCIHLPLPQDKFKEQLQKALSTVSMYKDMRVVVGHFTYVPKFRELQSKAGNDTIKLTEKESDILNYLIQRRNRPVNRQDLLRDVWQYSPDVTSHTIETHIYKLRQKLESQPDAPEILTTKDDGYVLKVG